jgi:hypothetical protein
MFARGREAWTARRSNEGVKLAKMDFMRTMGYSLFRQQKE